MEMELTTIATPLTMIVARPADQHPAALYLASAAPGSRRAIRQRLNTIAAVLTSGRCDAMTMPWHEVRGHHADAVRAQLAATYAPATANAIMCALHRVAYYAWRLGQITAEDLARIRDTARVDGQRLPAGRALSAGELRACFEACAADPTPATGARDAALLAILYGGGLRVAEAVAVEVADYDPETGALTVKHGKRNKQRLTYLGDGAAEAVAAWLRVRGAGPGPLLCPVDKAGRVTVRAMRPRSVALRLGRLAERARVRPFSPHDCRRSFVSGLLDAGADIAVVQRLAGHASVATTTLYDRRPEAAKRKAAALLHVPYQPRP